MTGLYIHIPFCLKKCRYCDFSSYPDKLMQSADYVSALCREMELYRGEEIDTVYFGGGTPSLLLARELNCLLESIHRNFKLSPGSEITIEANPGTIDLDKSKHLKKLGFNRVSLGAQSFMDNELKLLGRVHSTRDTLLAYELLRESGFSNISMDLMYAIPGQSMDTLSTSLCQMLKLAPEHISCYGLKIEEGTKLYTMLKDGEITEQSEDMYADMYEMICSCLKENGYLHYELSNFSKPGYESKHNIKYWTCTPYIGLGLGAASLYGGKRYTRKADFDTYLKSLENAEEYTPDLEEMMSEYMMLSLRLTDKGANKADFKAMFAREIEDVFEYPLKKHIQNGLIIDRGDSFSLSERAYYISNLVLCDFI